MPDSLKGHHYLIYGIIGIPLAFGALPLYMHIPKFYAQNGVLSLTLIGIVLWIVRLFDAFSDPFFGRLANTYSRRKLMVAGTVLFIASFLALCHPPKTSSEPWLMLWLFVSLSVTGISLSSASIAFHAWGASLGKNTQQRSNLVLSREAITLITLIIAAALPVLISQNLSTGVKSLSYILGVLGILCLILTKLLPHPNIQVSEASTQEKISFSNYLADLKIQLTVLWQDRTSRWLLIIFMLNGCASAIPATLFFFFVQDVLAATDSSGLFLATYFLSGALFMPMWTVIAKKFGRIQAWQASMCLAIASFVLVGFLKQGDVVEFYIVCFASGLALGADLCLPASMAADHGEKQKQSGILFGWWNLITKLNLAMAAGLALPILAFAGYQEGAGASNEAPLKIAYLVLPISIKFITLVLLSAQFKQFESINNLGVTANHGKF